MFCQAFFRPRKGCKMMNRPFAPFLSIISALQNRYNSMVTGSRLPLFKKFHFLLTFALLLGLYSKPEAVPDVPPLCSQRAFIYFKTCIANYHSHTIDLDSTTTTTSIGSSNNNESVRDSWVLIFTISIATNGFNKSGALKGISAIATSYATLTKCNHHHHQTTF